MKNTINIKIASDVVCPWCYVGKKELEKAMVSLKDEYHFEVQYLPFELSPDIKKEGEDFKSYMTNKFGNWDQFISRSKMLEDRGKEVGINFNIEKIGNTPNTFLLHRIIQFSHQWGLQSKVTDAYMKAYFEDLVDLTIKEEVIRIGVSAGLDEEQLNALIQTESGTAEIRGVQDNMRAMGISGVPFFIINDQYGISGAVPAENLTQAIKESNPTKAASDAESCDVEGCE